MDFFMLFDWCGDGSGVLKIFHVLKTFLNIIRIAVPIGLIIMTSIDVFRKVINPDDKEGQKRILQRLISAIIVFFVPTLVSFVMKLVDAGNGNTDYQSGSCWQAWENAE